jgi:predicted DNA-binding protein with PD1-like motif
VLSLNGELTSGGDARASTRARCSVLRRLDRGGFLLVWSVRPKLELVVLEVAERLARTCDEASRLPLIFPDLAVKVGVT